MTASASPASGGSQFSVQAAAMGLLVALVGYASSVAVVIQGLAASGAGTGQIASGLLAIGLAMGVVAIGISAASRMPVSIAWTTPGMVLLAAGGPVAGGFPVVAGAFVLTGLMVALAGLWTPLGRLVASIPRPIASAMLAGLLLKFCLAPFAAVQQAPGVALLVLATWILVGRFARLHAVPAAVAVALAAMALTAPAGAEAWSLADFRPHLDLVRPVFSVRAAIGIALPLFVVTMASQNVPGLAVLASYGYHPAVRPIFIATGAASALIAPFGGPTINLAAVTAALCAGPDAEARPERRWQAAVSGGLGYIAFTALAGPAAMAVTRSPPVLIEAVAGLALIGAFGQALLASVQEEAMRLPAVVTLLVTASGVSFGGIGSAFWGLGFGLGLQLLHRPRPEARAASRG